MSPAPSARRPFGPLVLGAGLALAVCGCTTTETTAARLALNDARLRATALPVRVMAGHSSHAVAVSAVTPLGSGRAVVVTLVNRGYSAVSDLPISVGYRLGSSTIYLNAQAGLNYFTNHIPAVPARRTLTWVYAGAVPKLGRGARFFARVGSTPSPEVGSFTPPLITSTFSSPHALAGRPTSSLAHGAGTRVVAVQLENHSSIPQYQLPVYAVVTRGGRIVAAKAAGVSDLAGGAQTTIHLALPSSTLGDGSSLRIDTPATIFR